MIGILVRKPRRDGMELQLTAMIDIFTILVIFLIKGTVMGVSDMAVPSDMRLPTSLSREMVESAPQVIIDKDTVRVSSLGKAGIEVPPVPLVDFKTSFNSKVASVEALKTTLEAYIKGLAPEQKLAGSILSVIADRGAPYSDIFDVIKVFRVSGFDALLFIGHPEGSDAAASATTKEKVGG